MVEVAETLEAKLKRHEDALAACMVEIQRLRAENASLKANASAHQTLKEIYGNPAEPTSNRIRAATAALACETPRLESVPPPLDLIAAEEIEPLSVVVERQRRRADVLLREARDIEVSPSGAVRILPKPSRNGGNGRGDSSD